MWVNIYSMEQGACRAPCFNERLIKVLLFINNILSNPLEHLQPADSYSAHL